MPNELIALGVLLLTIGFGIYGFADIMLDAKHRAWRRSVDERLDALEDDDG